MTSPGLTADEIREIEIYRSDPVPYFKNILGRDPWHKQIEVLHSVVEYPETYVPSANAMGKTDIAAGLVPYWLQTRRGIVITTANTWTQVETVLWERIKLINKEARVPTGLKPIGTKINVEENWFALGLSTNEPDRFQGYHDAEVLVIVEEAGGMNVESLWDALEGCLTGPVDRLLAIGNPTQRGTVFHKRCTSPDPDRNVVWISAYDSPNIQAGKIIVEGLMSPQRVERWRRIWGEEDHRFQSRVLGLFPMEGDDSLIPPGWLEAAFEYEGETFTTGTIHAGLDVARYGTDHNALAVRDGGRLLGLDSWSGVDLMNTSGRAIRLLRTGALHPVEEDGETPPLGQPDVMRIDADGLGSGVFDRVAEVLPTEFTMQHIQLEEFRASHATTNPRDFVDYKTEAYWWFRELLRTHSIDLSVLTSDQRDAIMTQAAAITYELDSQGRIKIAPKAEAKKKAKKTAKSIGGLLDTLEALIMAFVDTEMEGVDNSELNAVVGPYGSSDQQESSVASDGSTNAPKHREYLYANIGPL